MLSGKSTGDLGVVKIETPDGSSYRATALERTLIDVTVRPVYAGGAGAVLEAYRRALASQPAAELIEQLIATLDAVRHVYPYHQAVGFYLERAGAQGTETALLRARGLTYDFYLDYKIAAPAYDSTWRIYYPTDLD